jgi:4-hydroxybenzoate polyprenyltransferase
VKPYLQLLHFGPSVLTTAAFAAYILILARGLPAAGPLALLLAAQLVAQFTISLANDYFDAPTDTLTQPTKPIPAGVIRRNSVGGLAVVGAAATLALALPLGGAVLAFTALGLGAGLAYDAGLKRTLFSPLPFMLGFGVLPLWAAAGVGVPLVGPSLACAGLTAVLVVALHLADTLPDLESDTAAGVRGLAHRLGRPRAVTLCCAALATGQALALLLALRSPPTWLILAPTLALTVALLLAALTLYRRRGPAALPAFSGLIEAAALLTSLGWLAGAVL